MEIRIYGTVEESIVDGNGIRFVVFTQGCTHNCKGCHNQESHDLNGGKITDTDTLFNQIKQDPLLSGVTFSGGEPFLQVSPLLHLAKQIKSIGLGLIIFSGFTFEQLMKMSDQNPDILELLKLTNHLIDGKYVEEQRNLNLRFRGSENQRIIDVAKTLETGEIHTVEL